MCSVFIGWSFLFVGLHNKLMWFMSLGMGCLMVNSFLGFGATNEFKITYLATGPTEMRLYFMLVNTAITIFGVGWLEKSLLYIFLAFWLGICFIVYQSQSRIYKLDMEIKQNEVHNNFSSPKGLNCKPVIRKAAVSFSFAQEK